MASATKKVEECDVDCARAESRQFKVVRHHVLVVWRVAALQGNAVRVLVVLLLRLLLPREEEAAGGPLMETVQCSAGMYVQLRLNGPEQEGPEQILSLTARVFGRQWPHEFGKDPSSLRAVVDIVFHVHL